MNAITFMYFATLQIDFEPRRWHRYSHTTTDSAVGVLPHPKPHSSLLPSGNSISFFTVRAGSSYHAVSEVQAELPRQRISIQGWYHGDKALAPLHALPTLAVIKSMTAVKWSPITEQKAAEQDSKLGIKPVYKRHDIQIQIMEQLMTQQSVNLTDFLTKPPSVPETDAEVQDLESKASAIADARGVNPICERFVQVPALLDDPSFATFITSLIAKVQGLKVRSFASPEPYHAICIDCVFDSVRCFPCAGDGTKQRDWAIISSWTRLHCRHSTTADIRGKRAALVLVRLSSPSTAVDVLPCVYCSTCGWAGIGRIATSNHQTIGIQENVEASSVSWQRKMKTIPRSWRHTIRRCARQ